MSTAATTPPAIATATRGREPTCVASKAVKSAANAPSSPNFDGSPIAWPAIAPAAVPPTQPNQSTVPTPSSTPRSPRANAHDSSTTSCDCANRFAIEPRKDCATLIPIGA